jgi:hypothetical protein
MAMCALTPLENTTMNPKYEALTGLPLIYAVLKRAGYEMLGQAEGPFAFKPSNGPAMVIVTDDAEAQTTMSWREGAQFMLEHAMKMNAHFHVSDNEVTCVIGHHVASGTSYAQAAGRAMLMCSDPGTPESLEE